MDGELAMLISAHRAPEAVDFVVSYEVLALVLEVIDGMEERIVELEGCLEAITEPVDGQVEDGGYERPESRF
jgi:hypothetical protein